MPNEKESSTSQSSPSRPQRSGSKHLAENLTKDELLKRLKVSKILFKCSIRLKMSAGCAACAILQLSYFFNYYLCVIHFHVASF